MIQYRQRIRCRLMNWLLLWDWSKGWLFLRWIALWIGVEKRDKRICWVWIWSWIYNYNWCWNCHRDILTLFRLLWVIFLSISLPIRSLSNKYTCGTEPLFADSDWYYPLLDSWNKYNENIWTPMVNSSRNTQRLKVTREECRQRTKRIGWNRILDINKKSTPNNMRIFT